MAIDSGDAACLSALTAQIGHGPPFSDAEVAAVAALTVTHARDLTVLQGCTGLAHLRLIACELPDLMVCDRLPALTHLEVHASRLDSLLGAAFCEQLARIDLLFTSVRDASDLLGVQAWQRGTVVGNPWDETSWGALRNELERPSMLVDISSESDWQLTCQLWDRAEACCGLVADSHALLVRPGLPIHTTNAYDALHVSMGTIAHELRSDAFTLDAMFRDYQSQVQAPDLSNLAGARTLGTAADARGWIAASSLSAADKAMLDRFVQRFPGVVFYRASDDALDREAAAYQLTLPAGYRALRTTLDGWMPTRRRPPVRFDRFEGATPRGDRAGSITYQLGLRPHGSDTRAALLDAGFVIVGLSTSAPASTLAIRITDGDARPRVYEYSEDDILDAMSEHRDVTDSIYEVFPTYAAMLGHIVSIHPPDEEPVKAV